MAQTDLNSLVEFLRRGAPRSRVGLWRASPKNIGKEEEIAIHLGIEALDIGKYYLGRLPIGAEHVRLSASNVIATLDLIASSNGSSDCVLIYNLDLLLAGVKGEECQKIWKDLFNHFPNRLRALLIMIPETAHQLLPSETMLEKWQTEIRLI